MLPSSTLLVVTSLANKPVFLPSCKLLSVELGIPTGKVFTCCGDFGAGCDIV